MKNPATILARRRRWLKLLVLSLALAAGLVAAGCARGSYPLDIFYEMHYQQSFRAHEPPRLSPPAEAVAWFDGPEAPASIAGGQRLYDVNCSQCHGVRGQGDGLVLRRMVEAYGYTPLVDPDLTSEQVRALNDAAIEGFILNGVNVMPNFSKLLSAEERQAIIDYIRVLQQQ